MPPSVLEVTDGERLPYELSLRRAGYVPVMPADATSPRLREALPACRVPQVISDVDRHPQVVWAHPGRSGLDPRALGPLSLVRVGDGLGDDPLDSPLTLGEALRWLLDGDVEEWLLRERHRVAVGRCLQQIGFGCLFHVVADRELQQVSEALGDTSLAHCPARRTGADRWSGAIHDQDVERLARAALTVTSRLRGWYLVGVRGTAAWELARHGRLPCCIDDWEGGLTFEQVVQWCAQETPGTAKRQRSRGEVEELPVLLPGVPRVRRDRGLAGYARFQLARRGRSSELRVCRWCSAWDLQDPCRTCRAERRTTPLDQEWAAYAGFADVHAAYAQLDAGPAVACGHGQDCQGQVAPSRLDEGVLL